MTSRPSGRAVGLHVAAHEVTLDDALAVRDDLAVADRVVEVRAGLGTEAAAVCRVAGHPVARVDTAALPRQDALRPR